MPRFPRPAPAAVAALACLPVLAASLAGCASDGDGGAHPRSDGTVTSLTSVEWSSFSYPSSCFSRDGVDRSVRVRDYEATGPDGFLTMTVAHPVFGDVNGDGVADAAVTYRCVGANASPDTLLVYVATAVGPRLVDTLLRDEDLYVEKLDISGRTLTVTGLGYTASAPHCCPDENVRLTYRWSGRHLVLDQQSRTPRPQS